MKKIVFTGPESTGKTTLAEALSIQLKLPYVKEVARDYLNQLNRHYNYEDILNISMLQMAEEEKIKSLHPHLLICDTDLVTIKIWSEDKFNRCESWITSEFLERQPDIYFLCKPDFPWQHDKQREDPKRREHLFEVYKSQFVHYRLRFIELSGSIENRMNKVMEFLNRNETMF